MVNSGPPSSKRIRPRSSPSPNPTKAKRRRQTNASAVIDLTLDSSSSDPEDDSDAVNTANITQVSLDDERHGSPIIVDLDVETTFYEILEEEVVETSDLHVIGESTPNDSSENIPVRLLTDFTIYTLDSLQLVSVAELLRLDFDKSIAYGASGIVKRWIDEDDDSDEDETETEDDEDEDEDVEEPESKLRVMLTRILAFDAHWLSTECAEIKLDPKIYIRTKYAWYILDVPQISYLNLFAPYWMKHRLLHLIISFSLENIDITYPGFIRSLEVDSDSPESVLDAFRMLRRALTETDLDSEDNRSYIICTLKQLCDENKKLHSALYRVPLIRYIRDTWGNWALASPQKGSQSPKKNSSSQQSPSSSAPKIHNIKKCVRESKIKVPRRDAPNATMVTPTVGRIAQLLFDQSMRILKPAEHHIPDEPELAERLKNSCIHEDDPISMEWIHDSRVVPNYYDAVLIDGVRYSTGDVVLVDKGEDSNDVRQRNAESTQAHSPNSLVNTKWFIKICYMYEQDDKEYINSKLRTVRKKHLHGQWLQHGSQILLQESAHANGLFYINECDDLPLECIYSHCNLRVLGALETEPPENLNVENDFFVGLTWDQEQFAFYEMADSDREAALKHCKRWKRCISCGLQTMRAKASHWAMLPDKTGIVQNRVEYHVADFIYLCPPETHRVYQIAQIVEIHSDQHKNISNIKVRLFGRYDDVIRAWSERPAVVETDERRLFYTDVIVDADLSKIDGKVYVSQLIFGDSFVEQDDHFYVDLYAPSLAVNCPADLRDLAEGKLHRCKMCCEADEHAIEDVQRLLKSNGPLRGLELFSGAGGLSAGFDLSGFVETKWAVERDSSAALSFAANNPDTIVYNQCVNLLLQHAIKSSCGEKPGPLHSIHRDFTIRGTLPPMPKPGEVDFIYGGPPCQGFSRMNHHKKAKDIRNTLVCTMLSYVDFYRPTFFLLENVLGFVHFKLGANGGIQMGVVKFVLRTLTCLGYQAHFKVLQTGQYGSPQGRQRVIIWGAKRDVPLPRFPLPTHCFKQNVHNTSLSTGDKLLPPMRSSAQCAPYAPVTANDAISDLPQFDWVNPHRVLAATADDRAEAEARFAAGIRRFDAVSVTDRTADPPGFAKPALYPRPPLNRYQMLMRQGAGTRVIYQYTKRFPGRIVERVINIPLEPGANWEALPPELADTGVKRCQTRYGRIDGDSHFRTALTSVQPNSKAGVVLHPTQKRVITVREGARAQGFPDVFQFCSEDATVLLNDQYKQIGNAVPIPLALALGKELGRALVKHWKEQEWKLMESRTHSPEL